MKFNLALLFLAAHLTGAIAMPAEEMSETTDLNEATDDAVEATLSDADALFSRVVICAAIHTLDVTAAGTPAFAEGDRFSLRTGALGSEMRPWYVKYGNGLGGSWRMNQWLVLVIGGAHRADARVR
ncbi:hypothetical protein AJ80_06482 [Polytolypa hystricis UAMH7299]|uniref:Uncharacterized protein n=1 Tax=Polytolypa hystricis (strain UAMH7299) TaxID=1447883 RepID=A0A2B7XWR7_POLH7|nr:hypothetical protein AJ80_06482 [Polytolypa hystricis UAMH7299]